MAYEMHGDLQDRRDCFHVLSSLDCSNKSRLQLWEMYYKESIEESIKESNLVRKKAEEAPRKLLEELEINLRYLQASMGCLFQDVAKSPPITQGNFLV